MTLAPGDTVEGRYKIIKELDHGGMGSVFLAEHQLIKRRVALKLLRAELAEDTDVLERFMNEARAAGTLGHPNIVESTDMGFTRDGVPYIVFELLEGTLLTDEIYRVRGMPVRRALRIGRQIASALHAAHSAGVVHRDLKSDNIFLTDRDDAADHVKVLDFGISRFLDSDETQRKGTLMGTPEFMAPEQITNPDTIDHRADIYALGVILYEMLAGRRPFLPDPDPHVVFNRVLNEAPQPLGTPGMPPGLEMLLLERFLAKSPDERFATMKDAEAALAAFAGIIRPEGRDSVPIPMLTKPAQMEVVSLPPPPPRRANIVWLVVAIVAAVGGGALVYLGNSQPAPTDPGTAVVREDAAGIASAIDGAMKAAQLRADGLAQTPMLRAAIETDAKTVADMLKSEFSLKLGAGEAFELVQVHDTRQDVLSRVPAGEPFKIQLDNAPRLDVVKGGLVLIVSSPVQTQRGSVAGAVAISAPVDLTRFTATIAAHASDAKLTGLAAPIALVPAGAAGTSAQAPVPLPKELGATATLSETVPLPPPAADPLVYIRIGAWIISGIFAIAYAASLLRARRRG